MFEVIDMYIPGESDESYRHEQCLQTSSNLPVYLCWFHFPLCPSSEHLSFSFFNLYHLFFPLDLSSIIQLNFFYCIFLSQLLYYPVITISFFRPQTHSKVLQLRIFDSHYRNRHSPLLSAAFLIHQRQGFPNLEQD